MALIFISFTTGDKAANDLSTHLLAALNVKYEVYQCEHPDALNPVEDLAPQLKAKLNDAAVMVLLLSNNYA